MTDLSDYGCDVLNLEWSSNGRDREVASLICFALRDKGYKVIEDSIFNYRYCIERYRPKLLYLADPKGAQWNYKVARYAYSLGIPMVTFTAEGNLTVDSAERMFWGNIADRRLLETMNVQWSARDRDIALRVAPELKSRLKVGGAVGFDRYKIHRFQSKDDWMKKYQREFDRMIGYASWSFDMFYRDDRWAEFRKEYFGADRYVRFREVRRRVNLILKRLALENPHCLFLIKQHPGVVDPTKTEIDGLGKFDNVLVIRNEEAIADCINACDVWMAFESTTALEAWLLRKPTIFINPMGTDFPRSRIYEGCAVVESYDELQQIIAEFWESHVIKQFDEKALVREQIISDTIQWADGKNHMRVAHLFEDILLEQNAPTYQSGLMQRLLAYIQLLQFRVGRMLPILPRFHNSRAFSYREMAIRNSRYEKELRRFHDRHGLVEEEIAELRKVNAERQQRACGNLVTVRK